MRFVCSILLMFMCICFSNAQEDNISFRQIFLEGKIAVNNVVSIAQDSIGYLWIATEGELLRYNGDNFKRFHKQFDGVVKPNSNMLGKIYIDRQNHMWIITHSGNLQKYKDVDQSFNPIKNIKRVSTIFQDSKQNIWIGTESQGVYKIDAKSRDTISIKNSYFNNYIYSIIEDKITHKLLITSGGHIIKMDVNSLEHDVLEINGKKNISGTFSSLAQAENGEIWAGSYKDGLFLKSKNSKQFISFKFLGENNKNREVNIQKVFIDHSGNVWVSTYSNGVFLIKDLKINHFNIKEINDSAPTYSSVFSFYQDTSNVLWFGLDDAGLSYYDYNLEKFNKLLDVSDKNIEKNGSILAIERQDDRIWLGSLYGLKEYNFKTKKWHIYNTENSSISSNQIVSLNFIDNELWIGLNKGGLNILKSDGSFQHFNASTKTKLSAHTIWSIYKDSINQIWLGTRENGLLKFNKEQGVVKQYVKDATRNNETDINNIRKIVEGDHGELWLGTETEGIIRFSTQQEVFTSYKDKLSSNIIRSLYYNPTRKMLWIGTEKGGLYAFNTIRNSIHNYELKEGLPSTTIKGILPGEENSLWVSTDHGLTRLAILDSFNKFTVNNYNTHNNLQDLIFNHGAYFIDKNGYLYFGGIRGINWFHPRNIKKNPFKPQTVISKVEVFNQEQALIQDRTFRHSENTLSFTFSALQFSYPERNQYKYRLVNNELNTDWINLGNKNSVNFSNLNPGNYKFQVKSSNYDGVWNNTPVTYQFFIAQPWYLTNLAKAIYGFLFIVLCISTYKYIKWQWNVKMQMQVDQAEKERLLQLDELKKKVYTNIAHEFLTPLTLISGPIEKRLENQNLNEEDRTDFTMMERNSNRLLNLVKQLLDLSKLELGYQKLRVSQGDLSTLLIAISSSFQFQATLKNIHYTRIIDGIDDAWFDKDIIEKIVTNLLSNAFKYTPNEGTITFSATVVNGYLQVYIENNGNQFTKEQISNIFNRFYQTNENSEGMGVGLSLVHELVNLLRGKISVENVSSNSIGFTVILPIYKSQFKNHEVVEKLEIINNSVQTTSENKWQALSKSALDKEDYPILLIVEDNQDIRSLIRSVFKDNYQIFEAEDGELGIQKAIQIMPDIIISDIMMPKRNGLELTSILKQDERTSHIPIVLLTAKTEDSDKFSGLELGADDYIVKPFKLKLLKARVKNLVTSRKKLIDRYSQEFVLKPREITLTNYEEVFLNKIQKIMDKNIIEASFGVEDFSKAVGMSRMQLHRKLKALTGLSASEFIRSQRLQLALQLLNKSDVNISEIGYAVGFNNPSYFAKCFKETFGCSPKDYLSNL